MKIKGTEIVDTFAEAFEMVCAKVIITAKTDDLAIAAANSMTGFATSVIVVNVKLQLMKNSVKLKLLITGLDIVF